MDEPVPDPAGLDIPATIFLVQLKSRAASAVELVMVYPSGVSSQIVMVVGLVITGVGFTVTETDASIRGWLNSGLIGSLGITLPEGYADLFLGNTYGAIGEISSLLLLLGTMVLIARKIISWEIPFAYIASFGFFTLVFGGTMYGAGYLGGDVLFHLFSGGLILGAFYMATDPVTASQTGTGKYIYGLLVGIFAVLIRVLNPAYPEGMMLAILLMNTFAPLIDHFVVQSNIKRRLSRVKVNV